MEDKKTQWATIDKRAKDRRELMGEDIDPKAILVSGMMPKEMRSEVEQVYVEESQNYDLHQARLQR